jgi:hypothetical protein
MGWFENQAENIYSQDLNPIILTIYRTYPPVTCGILEMGIATRDPNECERQHGRYSCFSILTFDAPL